MEVNSKRLNTKDASEALKPNVVPLKQTSKANSIIGQLENDTKIMKEKAQRLGVPFVDPLRVAIEPSALSLLAPEMALRHQTLPICVVDNFLLVAMMTPDEPSAIKGLELLTGFKIRPAVAPKNSLSIALKRCYGYGYVEEAGVKNRQPKTTQKTISETTKRDRREPCTISVISNKGGVGKTHVAINIAYCLAKKGAKVLLIDADLGNADVSNKLGIFPRCHLMDFLENKKKMNELLFRTKYGFDLIASSYGEFKLANLYYTQKIKFIHHFKKISQRYEFAIFDLGAGISPMVMDFSLATDHTIIVTTPQDLISGYGCTKATFSRFKEIEERLEKKHPNYKPQWIFSPMLLINQVSNLRQGFKLFNTFKKAADEKINSTELKFRIKPEYLGAIPQASLSLSKAEKKKRLLLHVAPHGKAAQSIQHISTRFFYPEAAYDPMIRFKRPLAHFAAILSQKI
ncbi:MAG TPA: AAA family ATPase [Desulfobacterales bacterium]|nr:AAA family ATPase [Desulfobacterales bacterium]